MRRVIIALLAFVTISTAAAQSVSGGIRLNPSSVSASVTIEVAAFELGDWRVSPVVTLTAASDWDVWSADALAGLNVLWLPPESSVAVLVQVHYRVVWTQGTQSQIPELFIGFTF